MNRKYWEQRAENNILMSEKTALEFERDLKLNYKYAVQNIKKEIEAFYGKYAIENEIDLSTTKKRLTPDELLNFNEQAKKYLDEVKRLGDLAFTKQYKKHLKQLSGKAYISRLQELIVNINHEIEMLNIKYNEELGETLKTGYEDSYYKSMYNVQKQIEIEHSFTRPSKVQLEAAIKERWNGQNYSDRIWNNKEKLISQLEITLSQQFVRGHGPREVAREFSAKMGTSYNNSVRLVRTEMNYIANKGTLDCYKENEVVEMYEYIATLDSRTSEICAEMDGKIFKVSEAISGINYPPLHPNCRSTTGAHFDDFEFEFEERTARDEDGKSVTIADMSYYEWVDKYGSKEFKQKVNKQRSKYKE